MTSIPLLTPYAIRALVQNEILQHDSEEGEGWKSGATKTQPIKGREQGPETGAMQLL